MFSSLPSASKIYVNSCKPKQKNLNSAKRKRKKQTAVTSTPVHVQDEETLVSSSSLRTNSTSQISLNGCEESLEVELATMGEDKDVCIFEGNDNESSKSVNSNASESLKSESVSEDLKFQIDLNDVENSSKLISDSLYCDICKNCETTVQEQTQEVRVEIKDDRLDISNDESIKNQTEESDKVDCDINENHACNDVAVPNCIPLSENEISAPLKQYEDSSMQTSEGSQEIFNNSAIVVSPEEIKNEDEHPVCAVDTESQTDQTNQDQELLAFAEVTLHCEKNEIFSESSHVVSNEYRNSLGEDILKQTSDSLDSSSVKSDCCIATNIYDVHIDNSEQSSADENEISHDVEGRIQSPQQSEVSCTESIIYDVKNTCQNESASQSYSALERQVYNKQPDPVSNQPSYSISNNLPKNVLDNSLSLTDMQYVIPDKILSRSLSLPDNISKSKCIIQLNSHIIPSEVISCDNISQKCKIMLDKYTSTSEKSLFNSENSIFSSDLPVTTSDKATVTSDNIDLSASKKDMATTPVKVLNETSITKNKSISTSFKENSKLLMKVLPPVAVMQARARSYIFGSVGSTGSLLGNEELSRYFPENKVTVFVGTWNMNGHDPPQSVDDFLLPLDVSSVPDICVIGTQESMQSRSEWEILIQTTLGPSHVLFASTSFGVLHLSVFMRRDLIWFCSEPEEANIATRPGSMIKTKGAVAICFMFFGTSFLFVNSHLTAHEQKLKERLSDIEKICSALDLPKQIPLKQHQKGKDVTSRFDCVFWCGDLNFRVVRDRPSVLCIVEEKIKKLEPSCNLLMKHDQLSQAMAKGLAFHGFSEGVINFIPSYKFDVGTSSFDSIKQRVPSYTDRILYRSKDKSSVVCLHYNAVPEIVTSDHKPVYAVFKVSLKPGRDNIPLAAGLFRRDIYLEAVKRRARQLEVTRNNKQSAICSVM